MDKKNLALIIFTCEDFLIEAELLINRLNKIHNILTEVIKDWRPDIASIEQIFVAKNYICK